MAKLNKDNQITKEVLIGRVRQKFINSTNNFPQMCCLSLIDQVIDKFLNEMDEALVNGEEIKMLSHFYFYTKIRKPGAFRNLKTGKKTMTIAKRVPRCKFSKILRDKIANQNNEISNLKRERNLINNFFSYFLTSAWL